MHRTFFFVQGVGGIDFAAHRHSKAQHPNLSLVVDHDAVGSEVPMHDVTLARGNEDIHDLNHDSRNNRAGNRHPLRNSLEALPLNHLHYYAEPTCHLEDTLRRNVAWMFYTPSRIDPPLYARRHTFVVYEVRVKYDDRSRHIGVLYVDGSEHRTKVTGFHGTKQSQLSGWITHGLELTSDHKSGHTSGQGRGNSRPAQQDHLVRIVTQAGQLGPAGGGVVELCLMAHRNNIADARHSNTDRRDRSKRHVHWVLPTVALHLIHSLHHTLSGIRSL
jgi:hypothetical protein